MSRRSDNTLIYSLAMAALVAIVIAAAANIANPFESLGQVMKGEAVETKQAGAGS
jgi:hypothetical protein